MQTIKDSIKTVIVSLITLSLISVAYAWTEPTSNPPAGNTYPPITTASGTQTKTGWFTADNIETYGNTYLSTIAGNVGIGTTDFAGIMGSGNLKVAGKIYGDGSGLTGLPSIPVSSVFGRTGAVVAAAGDYSVSQVTGAAPTASPTFTGNINFPGSGIWDSFGKLKVGGNADITGELSVGGQSVISSDSSNINIGDLISGDGTRGLNFKAGDTPRLTVASDGKVGIGTMSPTKKFDISTTTGGEIVEKSGSTCDAGDTPIEYKAGNSACNGDTTSCSGGSSCTPTGYGWQSTYDASKAACSYTKEKATWGWRGTVCSTYGATCEQSTVKCRKPVITTSKFTVDDNGDTDIEGNMKSKGVILSALGSAVESAIRFFGDENTGLFSPAADTLSLATNGAERFRIDNNGKVKIGVMSPAILDSTDNVTINGSVYSTGNISTDMNLKSKNLSGSTETQVAVCAGTDGTLLKCGAPSVDIYADAYKIATGYNDSGLGGGGAVVPAQSTYIRYSTNFSGAVCSLTDPNGSVLDSRTGPFVVVKAVTPPNIGDNIYTFTCSANEKTGIDTTTITVVSWKDIPTSNTYYPTWSCNQLLGNMGYNGVNGSKPVGWSGGGGNKSVSDYCWYWVPKGSGLVGLWSEEYYRRIIRDVDDASCVVGGVFNEGCRNTPGWFMLPAGTDDSKNVAGPGFTNHTDNDNTARTISAY